jgi:hypothetical protein
MSISIVQFPLRSITGCGKSPSMPDITDAGSIRRLEKIPVDGPPSAN